MLIGIIGGSGVYEIFRASEDKTIETPYGEPSAPYAIGEISGVRCAFLARHGRSHNVPPDKVNYRANIWGFKELGVDRIISISASGGINPSLKPGDIVLMEQIIDMVQGMRPSSFFDKDKVVHVDFTDPYCPELSSLILKASGQTGIPLKKAAYICVNGPRLETRAEIKFFGSIGADIVGMTAMPETVLAREMEMCFGAVSMVTNYAAGIAGKKLSATEVVYKMKESAGTINRLLAALLPLVPDKRGCACGQALGDARVS